MRKAFFLLTIIALSASLGWGQKRFNLEVDYARFRANGFENYLEIYYSLYPKEWQYGLSANGDSVGSVILKLNLFLEDSLIDRKLWKIEHIKGVESSGSIAKLDLIRYRLVPGKYKVTIKTQDARDPLAADSVELVICNFAFPKTQLALSDLQLCRMIKNTSPESAPVFVKNQLEVIPNPGRIFGDSFPVIYFYIEIYNILKGISGNQYVINYFVTDYQGNKIDVIKACTRTRTVSNNSVVEIGTINISKLASGTYWIYFSVTDSSYEHMAYTRRRFFCYNPKADAELKKKGQGGTNNFVRMYSIFEQMRPIQVEKELEYIGYIATKEEKKVLKTLETLEAKRRFLADFWRRRDPDPDIAENEYRKTYLQRVRFANKEFSNFDEGWKTDFGRVYIIYGPPTHIERFPNTSKGRAYQIWTYENLQGGVEFVFVDIQGFQRYELVHSTCRGEIQNYNWPQLLELNYQRPPSLEY
ncbi:hypothetical protein DRQ15_02515 [candidate division KSB1 bacterium]|nr:MAG: hypothetical protein DRQ15_02515 [candidate division KSB1 bacterium]